MKYCGFVIVPILILFYSCNFPPTFGPEYQDPTINFIAERVITIPPSATDPGTTVLLDTPATWDWGWRGRTGNTYEYMKLETSAEPGPDAQSTPWLLRIVNLAENQTCTDTDHWQAFGTDASISNQSALHGTALKINATKESYIKAENSLFKDIDANPKSYRISLLVSNANSFRFFNGEIYQTIDLQNPAWTQTGFYTVPFLLTNIATGSGSFIAFATGGTDVFIDEIHLIRADIDLHKWSLKLILRQTDTSPVLVSGKYKFSLFVKKPNGYTFPSEDGRGNSSDYAVQYITLRLIQLTNNSTLAEQTFDLSEISSAWNRITIEFPDEKSLHFTEGTAEPILAIEIIPFSLQKPFAGALLIASPELNYFINGY